VRVVGLIPARGGSKGIPRKNLVPVAGKPLLRWTIEAALGARALERVVVSTDDDEIAAAAGGCEVVPRPAALAGDDTPMLDVVLHALESLEGIDAVCLLQPTSPLRRSEHVDAVVHLLEQSGADGVVTVVEVPHQFLPASLMALGEGNRLTLLEPQASTLRQHKGTLLARNGPAVLAVRSGGLAERGLYGGDLRGLPMDPRDSLDVDGPFELELAALLLEQRAG